MAFTAATQETAEQAVSREIREETGLDLDVGPDDVVAEYLQPWARHVDTLFAVRHDDGGRARRMSLEIAEVRWFPFDGLPPLTREAALALWHVRREGRA